MKILVFYPYIPYPLNSGTHQRTFHLLRELASVHEVDLLALAENGEGMEYKEVFEKFCGRVEFFRFQHPAWQKLVPRRLLNPLPANIAHWKVPGIAGKLDELLETGNYDAIHLCDIILAQYFMRGTCRGPIPERRQTIPIIIDRSRVDLLYQLMEHATMDFPLLTHLRRLETYPKLWIYERAALRRAALEIVCGEDDEKFLRRFVLGVKNIEVLINGVDPEYFYPTASSEPRATNPTLVFCGTLNYNPNIDGLSWYFRKIHEPLKTLVPNLEVVIVGKNPVEEVKRYERLQGVTVTGGVPDVRPFYRRAWLQFVPLRIGGGSRLKIVESLAMGTPVVSTTIGAQGLGLHHNRDILLADKATDFVKETARALQSEKLRKHLEEGGLRAVSTRLSWQILGKQLGALYGRYIAQKQVPVKAEAKIAWPRINAQS